MQLHTQKTYKLILAIAVLVITITLNASAQRYYDHPRSSHNYYSVPSYAYAPRPFFRPSLHINLGIGTGYYASPYAPYYRSYVPYGPNIGFRVNVLPYGYFPFYLGSNNYYYYDNTFYRRYDDRNYEVVAPPIGAKLPELPKNAKAVTIDGIRYFELGGTYYQETSNDKNQVLYEVVGVNGELKTNQNSNNATPPYNRTPQEGDIVNNLPDQCKTITLNGQTLYVSPDNIYYQQVNDGNKTAYKVVGK